MRARLDAIPGRAGLPAQLDQLDRGETEVSGATVAGGSFVYSKTRPEDAVAKIFIRPSEGGAERVRRLCGRACMRHRRLW